MWCLSMFKTNKLILIVVIVLAVLLSGCTGGQDVTPIVKALPEVQQFMKEHPNAKITVTYWSKEEVANSEISQQCEKSITPAAMYKATVSEGDLKIVSWIDATNRAVICSTTEGKQTAPTSTATPIQTVTATPIVTTTTVAPTPLATPVVTATPLITITPLPEITPTGNSILVKLDSKRGFIPNELIIGANDEIIWRNEGAEIVTLVSFPGLFNDVPLAYGEEYRYVFKQLGIYPFHLKGTNLTSTVAVRKITAISNETATVSLIVIRGNAFNPQTLTISKGTGVVWLNKDSVWHSVESVVWLGNNSIGQPMWDSGTIFDSGVIPPGETFSYIFNQAGTFEYGSLIGYTDKNGLHAIIPNGKVIVT